MITRLLTASIALTFFVYVQAGELSTFKYSIPKMTAADLLSKANTTNFDSVKNVTRGSGKNIFLKVVPSVVKVLTNDGSGSGIVISKLDTGYILTNHHVIEGHSTVGLQFANDADKEDVSIGTVIRYDEIKDLALVKLNKKRQDLTPLTVSNAEISVGDDVHAIGHPLGEDWTYTRGYVSQKHKDYQWQTSATSHHVASIIQTQTPINPGNSGGPLVNESGELVGINTFVRTSAQGLNYSVAKHSIQDFLSSKTTTQRKVLDDSDFGAIIDSRDENKNGNPDNYAFDRNSNDVIDLIVVDNNEDFVVDAIYFDDNENQIFELAIYKRREKSIDFLLYRFDQDEDGIVEAAGIDVDMDGEIDHIIPASD